MGEVFVLAGYYAEDDFSIFKCHGNAKRCVGGQAGQTCAEGREGLSCGQCEPLTTARDDGTCKACEGPHVLMFVILSCLIVIILVLVYYGVDTKDPSRTS